MIAFINKEKRHILRDYRTMVILFGMPLIQVLIFGFAITNEIKDANLVVIDYAKDYQSSRLIHKMTSSGYFKLAGYSSNVDESAELFKSGKAKQILVIEGNFAKGLTQQSAKIQIISDATDPNVAEQLKNYTIGIISSFIDEQKDLPTPPVKVNVNSQMYFNPELKGVFLFVPGTMAVILMLVSAMMTSISIAKEKETGTMEVLLVSPLKPWQIILGKVTPYVVLSFINALTILALGFWVFGLPIQGSFGLLLVEILLYIIMSLSLGIFISTISATQQIAMMLSMFALMLPTILLSGFVFPIENMPDFLQWLSCIMPSRWFIVIVRDIMLRGNGLGQIWMETLILCFMTLVFLGLSIKNFKVRL